MSVQSQAGSHYLGWSNPVAWWWGSLTLISGLNIAVWCALLSAFRTPGAGSLGISGVQLMFSAAYVFGCAFRSVLPRADVQRICLFDTWLSNVLIGRSVATVAEVCFAVQWFIVLRQLGASTGAVTVSNAAWVLLPLIVIAECFSWYAVLTRNYVMHAIENSLWAVAFTAAGVGLCRLLAEFDGLARGILIVAIIGIVGYVAFLVTIDVPMYVTRWRSKTSADSERLHPVAGLWDVTTRWVVTHDFAEWKEEMLWMGLYFSAGVWASLALCVVGFHA
jgi:hypothetical protein